MSQEADTPNELANDVFKHELKASEKMSVLFSTYEPEEAEDGVIRSFESLCNNIEDPDRLAKAVQLMQTMAQQLGSEKMMGAAIEVAQQSDHLDVEGQA
jgi:hypothetical protein